MSVEERLTTPHTTKHSKYANSEVELQQNECYASCNNNDKLPQYVQHDLLLMNNNNLVLCRYEVDQKQDAIDLQQNEAYCTHLPVSTAVRSSNTITAE